MSTSSLLPAAFPYAPLSNPSREIRLLRPAVAPLGRWKSLARRASLSAGSRHLRKESKSQQEQTTAWELVHETFPSTEGTSYYCLSHPLDTEDTSHSVIVDKNTISISKNLYEALHECRKLCDSLNIQPWALWVDVICINRKDDMERTFQVRLMRTIYQNAAWVLMWLGSAKDYSNWAMERLEILSAKAAECELWKLRAEELPDIEAAIGKEQADRLDSYLTVLVAEYKKPGDGPLLPIVKLMERSYWNRVWTLPEVAFASNAVMLCGSRNVTWQRFRLATQLLQLVALRLQAEGLLSPQARTEFSFLQSKIDPLVFACDNVDRKSLKSLLIESSVHAKMHARDPRDRVFALLGLCADRQDLGIRIDYTYSVQKVYAEVTKYYILQRHKGALNLLSYCSLDDSSTSALPSWVTDWRRPGPAPLSPVGEPRKKGRYFLDVVLPHILEIKSGDTSDSILVLEGLQLDTVQVLGDCYPSSVDDADRVQNIIAWLEQLMRLSGAESQYSISLAERQNAVLRTATADWEFDSQGDHMQRCSEHSIDQIYTLLTTKPPESTPEKQTSWAEERAGPYRLAMEWSASQRRTFASSNGRIGLGPRSLQPGDCIAEIAGSDVPFALRKGEKGRYRIVGEVYLHGVMDGEHRHRYFETLTWPKRQIFEVC